MRMPKFLANLPLSVVWVTASLNGAVIPGRWEKVNAQSPGTRLRVFLKSGDRIEGIFKESDPTSLILVQNDRQEMRLPKTGISRVEKMNDSLKNGALWGFAIGGGLGAILGAVWLGPYSENEAGTYAGGFATALAFGAGVGAAIGLASDYMIQGAEVIYVDK